MKRVVFEIVRDDNEGPDTDTSKKQTHTKKKKPQINKKDPKHPHYQYSNPATRSIYTKQTYPLQLSTPSYIDKMFVQCGACVLCLFLGVLIASLVMTGPLWEVEVPRIDKRAVAAADTELTKEDATQSKILIIGAGSAGLFAGYTLKYLGVTNFEILEANSDFGGRVQQMTDFADVPLDSGIEKSAISS